MPDLVLFAVIHISVSVALAALLLMAYRRLHRAAYLLYWAVFWVAIALNLAVSRVAGPLLHSNSAWIRVFTSSLLPYYPVLMICAGLSVRGRPSSRLTRPLLWGAVAASASLFAVLAVLVPSSRIVPPIADLRAMSTSFAVGFFAWELARRGRADGRPAKRFVTVTVIYAVHNFALGAGLLGIHFYSAEFTNGYSPLAATVGILLQFAMTLVLAQEAIERAAEAALQVQESGQRLRLTDFTLENSPVGIFWTAADGRFRRVNQTTCSMTGYSEQELLSMPAAELDSMFCVEAGGAARWWLPEGRKAGTFESCHRHQDGHTFPVEISTSRIEFEGAEYTVAFVRDVSGRKRAEAEQEKLQAQLSQSQKMESIGRLAGGIAHDFNNLLTVINGHSQLALGKVPRGNPLRERLEEVLRAGKSAAALTRQLLAYSRKQHLEPRVLDLNSVIGGMRSMLVSLVGEDIEVRVELSAEVLTVYADPHQWEQVMMNLAVNARDAMPGGGCLRIGTASVEWDDAQASRFGARAGRYAELSVADTGVGMDDATRQRIFEPFFTTKETGKGTGLGLSMVQGIVAQSGGHIDVSTAMGQGTTFRICLPLRLGEEPVLAALAPSPKATETQ